MKTFCFALLFASVVGISGVSAQSATPGASPLPATELEPAKTASAGATAAKSMDGCCCPMCKDAAPTGAADKDQAAKSAEVEKAVLELEQKWCEAEAGHDVAFLEKVEADDFTFTDASGKLTTKKDEIAEAKQGGDKIDFKLSDMKAHIYGNVAILTGQTTFNPDEGDASANAYRWTDVFVRQANGEWQVVASQATGLGQGKVVESRNE